MTNQTDSTGNARPVSRRVLGAGVAGAAATIGLTRAAALAQDATPIAAGPTNQDALSAEVVAIASRLPGTVAVKLWAPPDAGRPGWSAELNPDKQMFIASSFKVFALAELLRQLEATIDSDSDSPLNGQLSAALREELVLDESVWSPSAPVLNPPNLVGKVNILTALEAMISRSDNTATDMVLKRAGADKVRAFIDEIGLKNTVIPTSTRDFIGYLQGLDDWQNTTWEQAIADSDAPSRPILNDSITMASTPNDMVEMYSRSLVGEFFQHAATLATFRTVLMQADPIPLTLPLGTTGFAKGGSIDTDAEHALSFAGGLYLPNRWLFWHIVQNWTSDEGGNTGEMIPRYLDVNRAIFATVCNRLAD